MAANKIISYLESLQKMLARHVEFFLASEENGQVVVRKSHVLTNPECLRQFLDQFFLELERLFILKASRFRAAYAFELLRQIGPDLRKPDFIGDRHRKLVHETAIEIARMLEFLAGMRVIAQHRI